MASFRQLQFHLGQQIEAIVSELPSKGILIVEIEGRLYRVINASFKVCKVGEALRLRVSQLDPLEFQMDPGGPNPSQSFRRTV